MKLSSTLVLWTLLSSALFAIAAPAGNDYGHGDRDNKSLEGMNRKYKRSIKETLEKRGRKHECNSKTVSIRREWYETPPLPTPHLKFRLTRKLIGVQCLRKIVVTTSKRWNASSRKRAVVIALKCLVRAIASTILRPPTSKKRTIFTSMAIYMHGTVTLSGLMSRPSATSVVIGGPSLIGTGHYMPQIPACPPYLTAASILWVVMEKLFLTEQHCSRLLERISRCRQEPVVGVSKRAHFQILRYVARCSILLP